MPVCHWEASPRHPVKWKSTGKSGKFRPSKFDISESFSVKKLTGIGYSKFWSILVSQLLIFLFEVMGRHLKLEKSCLWARIYLQNGLESPCSRPTWRTLFICFQRCCLMALRVSLWKVRYCCQYLFVSDLLALLNNLCFFLHIRFDVLLNQGIFAHELVILTGIWEFIKDWTLPLKPM